MAIDSRVKAIQAAKAGNDAWSGDYTDGARNAYIASLITVRAHLGKFVDDPDLLLFLDGVLDSEIQSAPHVVTICECADAQVIN